MKRITYFVLLAGLVSSCGPSHPLNAVRVQYEDAKWHDYYLLESRDTSIVVYTDMLKPDMNEVLPLGKIQRIAFQGQTFYGEVFGPLGAILLVSQFPLTSEKVVNIVMPVSLVVGYCIGHFLTDRWIDVDPYSLEARDLLHGRSYHINR